MIESGNKQKDDETAKWLQDRLTGLEMTLKLPELTQTPKDKLRLDVALKIEFSMMRLARRDPKETELVRILVGMEDDLEDRNEPIVYPVFGRGLALWAIVGKGITEENLSRAAKFLVGPCSCEIKAQNPGVDLLLTADWEERLTTRVTIAPEPPPLASLFPGPVVVEDKSAWPTRTATSGTSDYPGPGHPAELKSEAPNYAFWRNVILAMAGGLALVVLASLRVCRRRQ
jgi:hypothetical protein